MFSLNSFIDENSFFVDNLSFPFSEDILLVENDFSSKNLKSLNSENKSKSIKFKVSKDKRKNYRDDIMKKIKSAAHRKIISDINGKLKSLGSKFAFKPLPQHFITDVTKKTNYEAMQLTYRELLEFTINNLINDQNYIKKDYNNKIVQAAFNNYEQNKKILAYLDSNSEIREKSGFKEILNTKYIELLRDYFASNEFELIIFELSQGKDKDYYNLYKFFSEIYLDYFNKNKSKEVNIKKHAKNNNGKNIFGYNSKENSNDISENPNSNAIINNDTHDLINPFLIVEENDLLENCNSSFFEDLRDENSLIFEKLYSNERK